MIMKKNTNSHFIFPPVLVQRLVERGLGSIRDLSQLFSKRTRY